MNILLAEDDLTSRTMLGALLTKQGYQVVEAADGDDAWRLMKQKDRPDIAVLDWMMPGLSGVDVTEKIRSKGEGKHVYIIMLTSRADKSDIVQALEAGANDYLVKPFDTSELFARIKVGVRMVKLQYDLADKVKELQAALSEVKTLKGLLPICCSCKKIRDDSGFWHQVEAYVRDHTQASFTHGLCPDCSRRMLDELEKQ